MRYLVHAPNDSGRYIGAAITPQYTRPAGAWSSRGPIVGQPGTQAIPVSGPAIEQSATGQASMGLSRSSDAPNHFRPSLYWEASSPHEHAPVSRVSDNQMPIPAVRPQNVIIAAPMRARKGGLRQVYQPQVVQTFPAMNGMNYG